MRSYLVLTLGLAACGTSPEGAPFPVADSVAMVRTNRRLTNIDLTSFTDGCSIADERSHPNTDDFRFMLADLDADAPPSAPATYDVYPLLRYPTKGLAARCGTISSDDTCKLTITECTSGVVTLTRVDASGLAGSFDVMLDGQRVTGSFDAPACPDVSEGGILTCQ
jgi:hypothetical protein